MARLYNQLCTYVHTRQFSWNPNSSTLEPDRPQRDCPSACVISQQDSSSACSLIELLLSQKKISPRLKKLLFQFLKLVFFNCLSPGVSLFPEHCDAFLVAFAKLPKASIRSVMSVRPHGTTGLSLDGHLRTWCFSDRASWIDYILITNFCALIIIYS